MKPVLLIAANLLREQRWYIVLLLFWVIGAGAILGMATGKGNPEDALFYARQQGIYAAALTLIASASALRNERRSRRILAVLSKAVGRGQYLAGLLCGCAGLALIYCGAVAVMLVMISAHLGWPPLSGVVFAVTVFASCLLVAAGALFLSTFVHPLLATAATTIALVLQVVIEKALDWQFTPALGLLRALVNFHFQPSWELPIVPLILVLGETALLWLLAARVFAGRDITVAIE